MTEYMQVSMLVNTILCCNKRYLLAYTVFNHPRLYPSILHIWVNGILGGNVHVSKHNRLEQNSLWYNCTMTLLRVVKIAIK